MSSWYNRISLIAPIQKFCPAMFHRATVRPKRWDRTLLYCTSLIFSHTFQIYLCILIREICAIFVKLGNWNNLFQKTIAENISFLYIRHGILCVIIYSSFYNTEASNTYLTLLVPIFLCSFIPFVLYPLQIAE